MRTIIKSKHLSYGTVSVVDNGSTWARYCIELNGTVKEVSDNLDTILNIYERNYF